jgi:molecular chaperone DnaK (HSP70)
MDRRKYGMLSHFRRLDQMLGGEMRLMLALLALGLTAGAVAADASLVVEGNSEAIGTNGVLLEAVGMEVNDGTFMTILPKGCKLPCVVKQNFAARTVDQPRIGFHLFRGNSSTVKSAHALGTVHISGFPATSYGSTHVVVKFVADSSGINIYAKNVVLDLIAP